jgi:tRNA pseudouridine32 synthase / 23S rRNA pseudouridine746 synthase
MLERNVTVRAVDHWWQNSTRDSVKRAEQQHAILQVYHGRAFTAPDIALAHQQAQYSMARFGALLERGLPVTEAIGQAGLGVSSTTTSQPTNLGELGLCRNNPNTTACLSETTMARLERYATFATPRERTTARNAVAAEWRATRPVRALDHVRILYVDDSICVVNKPSGVLAVPGPRRNPSLCQALYELLAPTDIDSMDQMVVHRLDMDTSGIMVYALTRHALVRLHEDFRHRRVQKTYQALVHGHVSSVEVELDVALERDPHRAPFMRIVQPKRSNSTIRTVPDHVEIHESESPEHARDDPVLLSKFLSEAPKPSLTQLRVLEWAYTSLPPETNDDSILPVTRVALVPHTGRTHQLRVHTAAIGHAILNDDIYGVNGAKGGSGDTRDGAGAPRAGTATKAFAPKRITKVPTQLCLHAHRLCLRHPVTGHPMMFECDPPF